MAITVTGRLRLLADFPERDSSSTFGSGVVNAPHKADITETYASGTSDDQVDRVWSTDDSVENGTPDTFDLAGSLTSKADGTTTITFTEITHIILQHTSGTGNLSLGAGSNPVSTIWGASGDAVVIGPGGLFVWSSPTNGAAVTAGTGDILTISSSSGTIGYSLMVVGRSA